MPQALPVRVKHGSCVLLHVHSLEDVTNLRRSSVDEDGPVYARCVSGDSVNQAVLEDGLRDGDEDGAAEGLEELDTRGGDGDVFVGKDCLDDEDSDLEADTNTEAWSVSVSCPVKGVIAMYTYRSRSDTRTMHGMAGGDPRW